MNPTNKSVSEISQIAEKFAADNDYLVGDGIDPFIRRIGGKVIYTDFESSLIINGPRDFIITLPNLLSVERDKFYIAHDLGHYVLHSDMGKIPFKSSKDTGVIPADKEANWFAAAFLMPEKDFLETCEKYNDDEVIAARYLVKPQIVKKRRQMLV